MENQKSVKEREREGERVWSENVKVSEPVHNPAGLHTFSLLNKPTWVSHCG